LKAGGVVVAMNPQYKARELSYQLNDSSVRVMMGLDSHRDLLETVRSESGLEMVIYSRLEDAYALVDFLGIEPDKHDIGIQDRENLWLKTLVTIGNNDQTTHPLISSDDTAIFQYSGGTTGIPKAAIGLHRNLLANTLQFRHWLAGMREGEEVVLAAIPLYHVYGMVIAMSVGVALGASLVLVQNPRNIQDILNNIQRYKATLFPGVPTLYQAINNHPDIIAGKVNLQSIKACISGSAPLLSETKERFEALTGGKLMEGYGLSEAPTATHCNPMFGENRTGSIGLPLPDVNCKIVDLEDASKVVSAGEVGELVISGPQVMPGYHNQPEEDRLTLVDGWLFTGDIARMDKDGYFYLIDRKKELIKISGLQVWPREVEEVIALHPKVKEVAVAGVPDPVKVEVIKAWVVPKPGETLTEDEIRAWCSQNLAHFKKPTLVSFREELPRTTVGKILRRELKRLHIEGVE
jgi:long-chain acyl-CoA synthetase